MKVCIFGDSVTKGIVYDDEKEKYVFLEDSFVHLFQQEQQIGVKNFSKFGCTTCKGVKILDAHVEELENFDYTVLEFGGNDCDYNWKDVSETPDQNHLPNVPLKEFVACYKNMLAKIIKSGSKPIMLSLPPLHAPGFFRCISKGLN
ncbi:MAG: SGNH/GDSL hydrolase family protein, partial [Anaerovorax sp.]